MTKRLEAIAQQSGISVEIIDANRASGILGLVLSVVFPPVGLYISLIARAKSRRLHLGNPAADLGVRVGMFLLILYAALALVGFLLSVVVPLVAGS
jgi:hypothetical protein